MAIRIDALDPTVTENRGHEVPAMREGITVKLTLAQILGLIQKGDFPADVVASLDLADSALQIIADGSVVTSKLADGSTTNAKLANMAQSTIKGRAAASGAGAPTDLTPSQARTALELGTMATQAANAVAITGGTIAIGSATFSGGPLQVQAPSGFSSSFDNSNGSGSGSCMGMNRSSSDGFAVAFYRAGSGVGSINLTGAATAYNTSSDGRLKPLREAFDAGSIIDALEPVRHNWLQFPDTWAYGVIAQDVAAVFPAAVTKGDESSDARPGDEGFSGWGVDYSKFVPLLIAEVKALRARLSALEDAP
jgi:hypothetical protein